MLGVFNTLLVYFLFRNSTFICRMSTVLKNDHSSTSVTWCCMCPPDYPLTT